MSMLSGVLHGGDQLVFTAEDFTSVKLANGKKGSPRPMVHRVILSPLRDVSGVSENMGTESTVTFRKYKTDLHDSMPIVWLRSGRIMLDFYMRGPMKRAVCTLTNEANAQLQVWLDSLEEKGLIKS